ncbi:MAG: GlcG/HbpS family heme-binding protein [Friedmanniella sp.]|jgi:glc operon protein GlcG
MSGEQEQQEGREPSPGQELSRRKAIGYGGAVATGVVAAGLLQPDVAEADTRGGSVTLRSVSLAQANRIVAAGVAYVRTHSGIPPMYILVVDVAGDEKASRRMDGNGPASVTLVPIKARTSVSFRAATADLAARTTDPARIASFTSAGFSLLGGGRPIVEKGAVIGAVAVGGGTPEQDDEVAKAALRGL